MSYSAIFVLAVIAVLIVVVALFLIRVIYLLRKIDDTLGKVIFGVRAIAYRTEPINPVVNSIQADLSVVAGALGGLLEKAGNLADAHSGTEEVGHGD